MQLHSLSGANTEGFSQARHRSPTGAGRDPAVLLINLGTPDRADVPSVRRYLAEFLSDPEVIALAQSIREHGVLDPLVISEDRFIISGHRRHVAAQLAGRKRVPCRRQPIRRSRDPDGFLVLLREHNRHRDKSYDETIREEIVSANPEEPYCSLIDHLEERSALNGDLDTMVL